MRGSKCNSCHDKHDNKNFIVSNVKQLNACGQEVVVVYVKEEEKCCTDDWAFYGPNHTPQRRTCCKFNTCHNPCKGKNY